MAPALPTITIEVNITRGIRFFIVGLADNAVKESHKRIESAILTNGYEWPRIRIVVNMAPADLRKEGSSYDLPIALGVLAASGQLSAELLKDLEDCDLDFADVKGQETVKGIDDSGLCFA